MGRLLSEEAELSPNIGDGAVRHLYCQLPKTLSRDLVDPCLHQDITGRGAPYLSFVVLDSKSCVPVLDYDI